MEKEKSRRNLDNGFACGLAYESRGRVTCSDDPPPKFFFGSESDSSSANRRDNSRPGLIHERLCLFRMKKTKQIN